MPESRRIAVCPGSFDPITLGHADIIRRATGLADEVIVAVSHSPSQEKKALLGIAERIETIREVFDDNQAIRVAEFSGLLVDFAREQGASLIVRGLRGVRDFEYEFQMALMNRRLNDQVETVFLAPAPEFAFVSSSLIREIFAHGGPVDPFLPPAVIRRLDARRT